MNGCRDASSDCVTILVPVNGSALTRVRDTGLLGGVRAEVIRAHRGILPDTTRSVGKLVGSLCTKNPTSMATDRALPTCMESQAATFLEAFLELFVFAFFAALPPALLRS